MNVSSGEPLEMIAEIKILGAGSYTKCITGGSIQPYLKHKDRITQHNDELCLGSWGLIPDYFRL